MGSSAGERDKPKRGLVKKLALVVILTQALLGMLGFLRHRLGRRGWSRRARRLAQGEAAELYQLASGREGWRQFVADSLALLHDFFIPHGGNDHRPHALRPPSLVVFTLAALAIKAVTSGALFLAYPTPARLAKIVAQEIVAFANRARRAVGLPTLAVDPTLEASASAKGQDMLARGYFAHDSPDGRKPWSWIDRSRYDFIYAGENLAIDFLAADTIHAAFMQSPSHRANILNGRYRDIGVAVVSGEMAGRPTELLVEFFGTRRVAALREPAVGTTRSSPSLPGVGPAAQNSPERSVARPVEPLPTPGRVVPPAQPFSDAPAQTLGVAVGSPSLVAAPNTLADATTPLPTEPILVVGPLARRGQVVEYLLRFANFFLAALTVFLAIALALNIFIRVRIQHPDLILQSAAVIALLVSLILTKFHFLERVGQNLRIL